MAKFSYFKLSIPIEFKELRDILSERFPEYQFTLFGLLGKGIMIADRNSGLTGARLVKGVGVYRIIPKPVSLVGRVLYAITL